MNKIDLHHNHPNSQIDPSVLAAAKQLCYQESAHFSKTCAQCEKEILTYQPFVEFDRAVYHTQCFNCKLCFTNFILPNQHLQQPSEITMSSVLFPIKDKHNKLFCMNDFIRTLKCNVCLLHFETDSKIHRLNEKISLSLGHRGSNEECETESDECEDKLAHKECVYCQSCRMNINVNDEYSVKIGRVGRLLILCKNCVLNETDIVSQSKKRLKKHCGNNKHRLSFRQKEQLKFRLVKDLINVNDILAGENEAVLLCLAKEIGCSKKSLLSYCTKNKKKLEDKSKLKPAKSLTLLNDSVFAESREMDNNAKIQSIVQELNKLDKIVAPNQCPFDLFTSRLSTKHRPNFLEA